MCPSPTFLSQLNPSLHFLCADADFRCFSCLIFPRLDCGFSFTKSLLHYIVIKLLKSSCLYNCREKHVFVCLLVCVCVRMRVCVYRSWVNTKERAFCLWKPAVDQKWRFSCSFIFTSSLKWGICPEQCLPSCIIRTFNYNPTSKPT